MNRSQSGFSHIVLVIVIILVVGLIGFVGWRVNESQNQKDIKTSLQTSQRQAQTKPNDNKVDADIPWLTYTNNEAGLTFKYPENWQSKTNDTFRYNDGTFGGVEGSLTSPGGNTLTWIYQTAGGKGGYCVPDPDDVAFTAGNKCASKQIISVEKAQSVKPPSGKQFRNLFDDSLYITKTKYLSAQEGSKISYQICLDPAYTSDTDIHSNSIPTTGTYMGLLFACSYWDTGFNAKYVSKDAAGLESADANTAIAIMKTFDSL